MRPEDVEQLLYKRQNIEEDIQTIPLAPTC